MLYRLRHCLRSISGSAGHGDAYFSMDYSIVSGTGIDYPGFLILFYDSVINDNICHQYRLGFPIMYYYSFISIYIRISIIIFLPFDHVSGIIPFQRLNLPSALYIWACYQVVYPVLNIILGIYRLSWILILVNIINASKLYPPSAWSHLFLFFFIIKYSWFGHNILLCVRFLMFRYIFHLHHFITKKKCIRYQ